MTHHTRPLSLLLALLLALSLALPALALDNGGEGRCRALVAYGPGADGEALTQALSQVPGVTVLYRYGLLFSGAAVEADGEALAAVRRLEGVSGAAPTQTHARPQAAAAPLDANSLDLMGAAGLEELGYDGDGVVVAVIDTGLRWTHQAFADYGLARSPAISPEDVEDFVSGGGTPGRYLSQRIPFAYDYADGDDQVFSTDSHGTHVAALAAGCAMGEDGAVLFRGVAPAAQLLSMKVFSDSAAGADDADILKALEDAYALGADVINLSLGSDNGFTADGVLGGLYCAAFRTLREAGVILCCSAGNSAASVSSKAQGAALPTADYTDYGTLCSPASYLGATAVAAAEAAHYETAGHIAAGGRQIAYADGVSGSGEALPLLESLPGEELAFVAVGGVGRAEDFAGLDLAGKVALVRRGEITFTEKAQNAAAAGAAACLIYNNAPGSLLPAVEGLTIPCAAISQEDGAFLLELAGAEGQGTLSIQGGAVTAEGEAPSMLDASAWGTTSDLRLVPALTAPGGHILSASGAGDGFYEQLSGTSMAAPNASGAFAVALQALRERGIEDKKEAADLAEALLESTARLIRDEGGAPLSPRRQGAGLIDLAAALDSPALITQPLLELGGSAAGRFTLSFRVRNLTEEALTLELDTTVLTDAYDADGADCYSLMAPLDITEDVTVSAPGSVTIPAGSERIVSLTLSVDQALRRELAQVYPNGFFTEGYVSLTGGEGACLHASFLGYCGDWEAAPIVEPVDFRDVLEARLLLEETVDEDTGATLAEEGYTYLDVLPVNLGANLVYLAGQDFQTDGTLLGQNPWLSTAHSDSRNAIPTAGSDALSTAGCLFTVDLYTLRNAARVIMVVSDLHTGRIYYVDDTPWLPRAGADDTALFIKNSGWFHWDGTGADGEPLPNNTQVKVAFYGWLESDEAMAAAYERSASDAARPDTYRWLTSGGYSRYLEWSFPLVIDRQAPTVSAAADGEAETLAVTIRDNQFLAYASICDGSGRVLAEGTFSDDRAGKAHTLTVDLTDCELLPDKLYVSAADYASNATGYTLDVSALADGQAPAPELCAMALLTDVDKDAWYHEAVDYVYAAGLMSGSEPRTFQPTDGATRVQVLSILYRLAGSPPPEAGEGGDASAPLPFTDVQTAAWYRDALVWAYGAGLVEGYNETTFGAFAIVSRQQLASLLYRFVLLTDGAGAEEARPADLALFPDSSRVSDWAEEAVAWAVGEGYLSGRADGFLAPRAYVTRAELAQVLMRFLENTPHT